MDDQKANVLSYASTPVPTEGPRRPSPAVQLVVVALIVLGPFLIMAGWLLFFLLRVL